MLSEFKGVILNNCPKTYFFLFACLNKDKFEMDKYKRQVIDQNEILREEFLNTVRGVKSLYKNGELVLNEGTMSRLKNYLDQKKILTVAGVVDKNDKNLNDAIHKHKHQTTQENPGDFSTREREFGSPEKLIFSPIKNIKIEDSLLEET